MPKLAPCYYSFLSGLPGPMGTLRLCSDGAVLTAIDFAGDSDASLKAWETTAREKPGTAEAAQALLSLVRRHLSKVTDEKTGKLLRAPNYAAAAAACDKLLDEEVYTGQGFAEVNWKGLKAEAGYDQHQAHQQPGAV